MNITIELTEAEVKALILEAIESRIYGSFDPNKVTILVKSKQNYKSEWEEAAIKVTYSDTQA